MAPTPSKKLSRLHKPPDMTLEAWQRELRRQFGREQAFTLTNVGADAVFSQFDVHNPRTGGVYRVAIRGTAPGVNYCGCPDFATNSLGTCKHVEFVLERLQRRPRSRAVLRQGFRPPYSEIVLHYGARREVRLRRGTTWPKALTVLARGYFDADDVLRLDAFDRFDAFLARAARTDHELRCYDDVLAFVAELRDRSRRQQRIDQAFPRGARDPRLRRLLKTDLYPYQREGALFAGRAGRCLIGDEMGLGKTVQALAAAEIMAQQFGVERVLIVCPTSLKHQWEREIQRFTARTPLVVGGGRPARELQYAANGAFFKITNYDTVYADLDLIAAWGPDLVVLDEAQRIKNWDTRAARSVKRIVSPYALVLTGTPLENRLEELASIVDFVDRHRLGPTYRFLADHQVRDDNGKVVGYRDLDRIGQTLAPVLIRRTKAQVLEQLPTRLDKTLFVAMTPGQRLLHEENRELVARIVAKWRRHKFLSEADQRRLMIGLQNMRMSCDSTYLLDGRTDAGVKADELMTLLDDLLEAQGTKVVVFSQWVRMHELLVKRLERKRVGHVFFHGGVDTAQRKALVDRFREDEGCRAFLSTDAGGVGLNLQHASVVVNMDLPWNPAVLEQRIGRVHRLGQRQPVRVVNFVAEGTIEEGMLTTLAFKKSLFAGVLDGGEREVFLGGSRLTRFMESVEQTTAAIGPPQAADDDVTAVAGPAPSGLETPGPDASAPGSAAVTSPSPAPPPAEMDRAWAAVLQAGVALLEQVAAASKASSDGGQGLRIVQRDPTTGEDYLRIPLPPPELLERLLHTVLALTGRDRR